MFIFDILEKILGLGNLCMIFQEECLSCYILLTDQISFSDYNYIYKYIYIYMYIYIYTYIYIYIYICNCNQKMKFGQLTEYNMRDILLEKSYTNFPVPESFLKCQKWTYLFRMYFLSFGIFIRLCDSTASL